MARHDGRYMLKLDCVFIWKDYLIDEISSVIVFIKFLRSFHINFQLEESGNNIILNDYHRLQIHEFMKRVVNSAGYKFYCGPN